MTESLSPTDITMLHVTARSVLSLVLDLPALLVTKDFDEAESRFGLFSSVHVRAAFLLSQRELLLSAALLEDALHEEATANNLVYHAVRDPPLHASMMLYSLLNTSADLLHRIYMQIDGDDFMNRTGIPFIVRELKTELDLMLAQ